MSLLDRLKGFVPKKPKKRDWFDGFSEGYEAARSDNLDNSPDGRSNYALGYREGARTYWDSQTDGGLL